MRKKISALLLLSSMLTGCMVGPDYCCPQSEVPDQWRTELDAQAGLTDTEWWKQLGDPVLNYLVHLALIENRDLKIAAHRVCEFLALYDVAQSALYPRLDGELSYGRERISEAMTPSAAAGINPQDIYRTLLRGSWEIDLWGKLRRETEAACAELLATHAAQQAVIQTLVAGVASTYVELLRLDQQVKISIQTAETRKETLVLFTKQHDAGIISGLELSQVQSEYQQALARIPELEKGVLLVENALSVLIGRPPESITRGKDIYGLQLPDVPEGLPSDLICSRPDVRQAEQELIAANARIGVAKAAYFPSLSLTAAYGYASPDLSDLLTGSANIWSYAAPLTIPIFTAGRIRGQIQAAEAFHCQSLENYKQTLLVAFSDVEDSLVEYQKTGEQLLAQEKQITALQAYARLANLRFDEGYASYIEVLDAQRSLFNLELEYTQTYSQRFLAIIGVYRSLGGSWIDEAEQLMAEGPISDWY